MKKKEIHKASHRKSHHELKSYQTHHYLLAEITQSYPTHCVNPRTIKVIREIHNSIKHPIQRVKHVVARLAVIHGVAVVAVYHPRCHAGHARNDGRR